VTAFERARECKLPESYRRLLLEGCASYSLLVLDGPKRVTAHHKSSPER
jgi:hypothetical protein